MFSRRAMNSAREIARCFSLPWASRQRRFDSSRVEPFSFTGSSTTRTSFSLPPSVGGFGSALAASCWWVSAVVSTESFWWLRPRPRPRLPRRRREPSFTEESVASVESVESMESVALLPVPPALPVSDAPLVPLVPLVPFASLLARWRRWARSWSFSRRSSSAPAAALREPTRRTTRRRETGRCPWTGSTADSGVSGSAGSGSTVSTVSAGSGVCASPFLERVVRRRRDRRDRDAGASCTGASCASSSAAAGTPALLSWARNASTSGFGSVEVARLFSMPLSASTVIRSALVIPRALARAWTLTFSPISPIALFCTAAAAAARSCTAVLSVVSAEFATVLLGVVAAVTLLARGTPVHDGRCDRSLTSCPPAAEGATCQTI